MRATIIRRKLPLVLFLTWNDLVLMNHLLRRKLLNHFAGLLVDKLEYQCVVSFHLNHNVCSTWINLYLLNFVFGSCRSHRSMLYFLFNHRMLWLNRVRRIRTVNIHRGTSSSDHPRWGGFSPPEAKDRTLLQQFQDSALQLVRLL